MLFVLLCILAKLLLMLDLLRLLVRVFIVNSVAVGISAVMVVLCARDYCKSCYESKLC
jgi:hypothetical protein